MEHFWDTLISWSKWSFLALTGVVLWIWKEDRSEVKDKISKIAQSVSKIEETRPTRDELIESNKQLREELRSDILDLNSSITARLDILIQLTKKQG